LLFWAGFTNINKKEGERLCKSPMRSKCRYWSATSGWRFVGQYRRQREDGADSFLRQPNAHLETISQPASNWFFGWGFFQQHPPLGNHLIPNSQTIFSH